MPHAAIDKVFILQLHAKHKAATLEVYKSFPFNILLPASLLVKKIKTGFAHIPPAIATSHRRFFS